MSNPRNRKKCKECGELKYPTDMIKLFYGETAYFCDWKCLSKYACECAEV